MKKFSKEPKTPLSGEKKLWRSLDEYYQTNNAEEAKGREFTDGASVLESPISRKSFLQLLGASFALAGLTACRRPEEKILPYTDGKSALTQGKSLYYSTTFPLRFKELGIQVESHEGRPTKIEGNPIHRSSKGSSNSYAQAAIFELYDPDRSTVPKIKGASVSVEQALQWLRDKRHSIVEKKGQGVAFLQNPINSPTVAGLIKQLKEILPEAHFHQWEPSHHTSGQIGIKSIIQKQYQPNYLLDQAQVIVSLDADFLGLEANDVLNAKAFAKNRNPDSGKMSRLYAAEPAWSLTGSMADHRLRISAHQVPSVLVQIGAILTGASISIKTDEQSTHFIKAVVQDLIAHKGRSLILVGMNQPIWVHELALRINLLLENGALITLHPVLEPTHPVESITDLTHQAHAGKIDTLFILGCNPVYDAPANLDFDGALKKINSVIHLGLYADETAQAALCHIPEAHFLESWGDVYSSSGVLSPIQPLISPLFDGITEIELLGLLVFGQMRKGYDILRSNWLGSEPCPALNCATVSEFDWENALRIGLFEFEPKDKDLHSEAANLLPSNKESILKLIANYREEVIPDGFYEVVFPLSYSMYDGRYNNNGWLQELPDPFTKLVWDNAALVCPSTAASLGVQNNQLLELVVGDKKVKAPVYITPGVASKTIVLSLGYGRTVTGRYGQNAGVNAYKIRSSAHMGWVAAQVTKLSELYRDARTDFLPNIVSHNELATTQKHLSQDPSEKFYFAKEKSLPVLASTNIAQMIENSDRVLRSGTLEQYLKEPKSVAHGEKHHGEHVKKLPLWDPLPQKGQQWGMAIDLTSCIGCGACAIACQAENNIPIVGKNQVLLGRHMNWIRIDRYYEGEDIDNPLTAHQPVACVHCENAPCENVCPAAATTHSSDGLNDMTYNRCIGTRYCANNCHYKVRRFNFLDYRGEVPEIRKLMYNPEVTLRSRGVMEKCTYCVQRIRKSQTYFSTVNIKEVPDGEIVPACAQACPTQAIVFGDISNPNTKVSQIKASSRSYQMLDEEFNTKPRTSYGARIRNNNPELT